MNMKTIYKTPCISIQPIYHSSVICGSGDRVSSNVDVHGGDNSGDATQAY